MHTRAESSPEPSRLPASETVSRKSKEAPQTVSRFADNRPPSMAQQELNALPQHTAEEPAVQRKANQTGLPDNLKGGIEQLSGLAMDDVKVHYNSAKPSQLQAHAYAQGTDIHLGAGQEKHLPHEAWHVVQQKQGRVKPTLQLKSGIPINDDDALEKEADVMGAKALQLKSTGTTPQSTSPASDKVVQRAITIGETAKNPDDIYSDFWEIGNLPWMKDGRRLAVLHGLLPAYSAMGKHVENMDELLLEIGRIINTYCSIDNADEYSSFKQYLNYQKHIQQEVKAHKSWYRGLVTTVGFEHEFSDMQDGPLAGVSHIEIAKSTEGMPYTAIKFLVETDASNALELVSPPFLFPTTKGSTVPRSSAVSAIDKLMKWALYSILTERKSNWIPDGYYNRKYITQTMEQLMGKLGEVTGFTFELNNPLVINPEYLSHNTNLERLGEHLDLDLELGGELVLKSDSLKNINVGKSEKGSGEEYNISSQVNFATDMNMARHFSTQQGVDTPHTRILSAIENELRQLIPLPEEPSAGLRDFYPILIGKLGGLFSAYSQQHVTGVQQKLHQEMVARKKGEEPEQTLPTQESRKTFEKHASFMSFVKDVTPVWIKDHALSIAKGMLEPGDYPKLYNRLNAADIDGFDLPDSVRNLFSETSQLSLPEHWDHFKNTLKTAVNTFKAAIENFDPENMPEQMDQKPDVELYGHDPEFTGGRQDTYQNPKHIQMPEIHDKRLHLVEIRRGDPSKKLQELEGKL